MKKRTLFILIAISYISVSCSDFLETKSASRVSPNEYYTTLNDFEGALIASYSLLKSGKVEGNYKKGIPVVGEAGTDECLCHNLNLLESWGLDQYNTLATSNSILSAIWQESYNMVNATNEIISRISCMDNPEKRLLEIKGEAQFLQALAYFNLVRIFGGVPVKTKPSVWSDDFSWITRDSVATVYKHIFRLLGEAYSTLPEEEHGGDVGRADKYAASGLLAKAYLQAASSMNLLQPKLSEDIKLGGINSYEWTDSENGVELSTGETMKYYYRQAAAFAQITLDWYGGESCLEAGTLVGHFYPEESTRDVLFECDMAQDVSPNQGGYFCFLYGPSGPLLEGGGHDVIHPINSVTFANYNPHYEKDGKIWSCQDRRFLWSLANYKIVDGEEVILAGNSVTTCNRAVWIHKFHSNRDNIATLVNGAGVNCPILRLSDVCLINAEALGELSYMENGTIGESAFAYLNAVRKNAGCTPYTMTEVRTATVYQPHKYMNNIPKGNKEMKGYVCTTDIEHWRRTIMNERLMELLGEGHRWFDLVRMGLLKDVVNEVDKMEIYDNTETVVRRTASDFHVFRPIPLREIRLHHDCLKQNFGYY